MFYIIKSGRKKSEGKEEEWSLRFGTERSLFCLKGKIKELQRREKGKEEKVARGYSWGPFNVFQRHKLKNWTTLLIFSSCFDCVCLNVSFNWVPWVWDSKMSHRTHCHNLPLCQDDMPKPPIFCQKYHRPGSNILRSSQLPTVVAFKLCSLEQQGFPKGTWRL